MAGEPELSHRPVGPWPLGMLSWSGAARNIHSPSCPVALSLESSWALEHTVPESG